MPIDLEKQLSQTQTFQRFGSVNPMSSGSFKVTPDIRGLRSPLLAESLMAMAIAGGMENHQVFMWF